MSIEVDHRGSQMCASVILHLKERSVGCVCVCGGGGGYYAAANMQRGTKNKSTRCYLWI